MNNPARYALAAALAAVFMLFPLSPPAMAQASGVRFDLTINLTAIITVAVMAAGGIAAWVTVRVKVKTNADDIGDLKTDMAGDKAEAKALLAGQAAKIEQIEKRIEQVRAKGAHQLSEFQIEVARNYATASSVSMVEERIASALEKLDGRLEKLDTHLRDLAKAQASRAGRSARPGSD